MNNEQRFDTEIIDVDLETFPRLYALSTRWQCRNHAERVKRIKAEATGPQVLA